MVRRSWFQPVKVILARVVVGLCAKKAAVKEQRQLLRPEHREPPTGPAWLSSCERSRMKNEI